MRQIKRDSADVGKFNSWAKKKKLRRWQEFSAPSATYINAYKATRKYIGETEQSHLSAYTEKPLGAKTHIDHFRKRDLYPKLTFDYANFLADELNDNYGACYKDKDASVTKATFDGTDRIFNPASENMADVIGFMLNGTMIPKQDLKGDIKKRVTETIRVFNLNHKSLKDTRKYIINLVTSYRKDGFTPDEIKKYMEEYGFPTIVNWALNIPLSTDT
ncbi:MAG: TIGR02646 family protein [Muribaculaceae bacterium]|nr:TIGR02646 family protein [Muribaculaceae bacterium]